MISALKFVPRGAAKSMPDKFNLDEDEFNKIQQQIGLQLETIKLDIKEHQSNNTDLDETTNELDTTTTDTKEIDELKEYDMDTYEQDEGLKGIPVFGSVNGLSYHEANEQDPYITIKETEEEEMQELEILEDDNLLLACRTEDEVSHLEVYVYEEAQDNLYVHHDIMLPSFPLCVEWLNYSIKQTDTRKGNLVAIGTFDPEIEIWDLDTIDTVYPQAILGANPKNKKSKHIQPDRHIAAITCLSWNKSQRNLLLSGSADTTVKLWDLNTCTAVKSYTHHKDKVSAIQWNPLELTVFLTGGYDSGGRVCALDSRAAEQVASWQLESDVECIRWDPFRSERFLVSTEDGLVRCYDARNFGKKEPVWVINAHDSAVSAMDLSVLVDGLLVTGSSDKSVKVWDVREGHDKSCLASRDLGVGKVFSADFSMDSAFVLACAGSKGKIVLWNLYDNAGVRKAFNSRTAARTADDELKRKEVVSLESDEEESDHEDENQESENDDEMEEEK